MSSDQRQPPTGALNLLVNGSLDIVGRLPWSSNFTFLVDIVGDNDEERMQGVYKPEQGEQELWDFPPHLYKREVAAYELSASLGWPNVPPTVIRANGPAGVGSLQQFIPSDFEQHYFTLYETGQHDDDFLRLAVFDVLANNTDRKAGHCLLGNDGVIYAIDNGLCFHAEPKLRTVIWEFQNTTAPPEILHDIDRVCNSLPTPLEDLLQEQEYTALQARMQHFLEHPVLPELVTQRQYPWPVI
jgi:uncharacterized repeat protein (TIGR03843 family)